MEATLTGRAIVATHRLQDANFHRAVVILLAHGDEGAFGVVVNRPSGVALPDQLAAWAPLAAEPAQIFLGGPVNRDAVVSLGVARRGVRAVRLQSVRGRLGIVDLTGDPLRAKDELRAVRMFAGYAGWDSGQLETEVDDGAWFVVDPVPTDVVTRHPERLWRSVLARQGGIFTTVPLDPSQN